MIFGPDFYHGNLALVPAAKLAADARNTFVILKVTQGTSYSWADSWFPQNAQAVRATRLALGGYHMLDGESGSGAAQAAFFLSKYKPQPGDLVPAMDFEASGRKRASIAAYRALGEAFIGAIHTAGFECMIYGHADVKAAWSDWRASGADYWWQPGDQVHSDVGPQGPDLWQYGPFTTRPGFPTGGDYSVVLTTLPRIGRGDDMTDDEKAQLKEALMKAREADAFKAGIESRRGNGAEPPQDHPLHAGWQFADEAFNRPASGGGGGVTQDVFDAHRNNAGAHAHHHPGRNLPLPKPTP